jgi:hypothetical protein
MSVDRVAADIAAIPVLVRRSAQSRVFYSFVTACRASKLALRSYIKHEMIFVI